MRRVSVSLYKVALFTGNNDQKLLHKNPIENISQLLKWKFYYIHPIKKPIIDRIIIGFSFDKK